MKTGPTACARELLVAAAARDRLAAADARLAQLDRARPAVIVGATLEAARSAVYRGVAGGGVALGWHPVTLELLARRLAVPVLAEQGLAPVSGAGLQAVVARVLARLAAAGELGRYQGLAEKPGLAPAIARTITELRMCGTGPEALASAGLDLARIAAEYERELGRLDLADRAAVCTAAVRAIEGGAALVIGAPCLLIDVAVRMPVERDLVAALAAGAASISCTAAAGDRRTIALLGEALGVDAERCDAIRPDTALARAQRNLFAGQPDRPAEDASIAVFSAPGESRECVEIARRIVEEARGGTRFDRIAVLLRVPSQYRSHLVEAFRRAGIPGHFTRGTVRPDASGRALLTLLDCAEEGLSARAFAEYLSLSVVPPAGPPPRPRPEPFVPPEDFPVVEAAPEAPPDIAAEGHSVADQTPAPRRWERLLIDAAVIGGLPRWDRRLGGLARELAARRAELEDPDDPRAATIERELRDLDALRAFAMPLLALLSDLPAQATWGEWLARLSDIAIRAIRDPDRVLAVLAELEPMSPVGPVGLREARHVLAARLADLVERPAGLRPGKVYVAAIEDARGLDFDVVFVPGLAERVFPQKVVEDPILLDERRRSISADLATSRQRIDAERAALHLALGAASRSLVLSYPRLDSEQARPRVPSFYGLEVLRAGEGVLPGFRALAERARDAGSSRMRWPAPDSPARAIDEAEYDLAVLERLLREPPDTTRGSARYLMEANPHLARALRFRARRWSLRGWTPADGLVIDDPAAPALERLQRHRPAARVYSATSLQAFAACPYRFYLRSIVGLAPREAPEPIEELNALQRGSLFHRAQYAALHALRDAGLLPVRGSQLARCIALLDAALDRAVAELREELVPAIERVWWDGVARMRRDLHQWMRRLVDEEWTPTHFELSFGLPERVEHDPGSRAEPVHLECGLVVRGAIDMVERRGGRVRATDHKTGRAPAGRRLVIGGGETLQPVIYGLVLAHLFPELAVDSGRLYFCTERGGFRDEIVPIDDEARAAAALVASTVDAAISAGFLPAIPNPGACTTCDYVAVCGPYENARTSLKKRKRLEPLALLRKHP